MGPDFEHLMTLLSKLPGLGPRSARRAALYLLKNRDTVMHPLAKTLEETADAVRICTVCGNMDVLIPCTICRDEKRDSSLLCVVEQVQDLWALERSRAFRGKYHILGGILSALDGVRPEDLNIRTLIGRAGQDTVEEVILALSATVDGQTTAHYLTDKLQNCAVTISELAHGVPIGGELDYMDDGTIVTALKARRVV